MPEPLPLSDLLASLRDQGLPVGVREHLVVGRLLARWDDTEPSSLRGALGAVLGRNPDEVRIVHKTFDRLYGASADEAVPAPVPHELSKPRRRVRRAWIAGSAAAILALALIAAALLWPRPVPEPVPLPPPAEPAPAMAPPPPEIPDTVQTADWERSFTAASGVATGLFLWLFGVRLRREARHRARRTMVEAADTLPGPHRYEMSLDDLAPPFSRELLDDTASLLGRRTEVPPRHGDLDVERTLARTLRAGLAPQIVLRARASTHPILVLEDVGDEMRPWRRRVSALLDGLETRGVPIDHWRFHADAGRVFRDPGMPPQTLKQLFRLRAESPLLVVSAGEGLLEGIDGRPAPWAEALRGWRHRAWLHPVTDPAYWRPALHAVPIHTWPMTPAGVMAAARQLIHGETGRPEGDSARALPQRRVSPLDVERLRWLLTLAPRRDPDLAELLRQRFCPQVPPAALLEALESPPLATHPGVGPAAEEVHTFLADLLATSEPQPGTAAYERWRLDRAVQEIRVPGREKQAVRELTELARGPLAAEVVSTVERWTGRPERRLHKRVLRHAFTRADRAGEERRGWRWTWPDLTEIAAALACLGLLGAVLPSLSDSFERKTSVQLEKAYRLRKGPSSSPGYTFLEIAAIPGWTSALEARLFRDGQNFESVDLSSGSARLQVPTGHWFDLRQPLGDGRLAVSEAPIWIEPFFEPAPPLADPKAPNTAPTMQVRDTPAQTAGDNTGEIRVRDSKDAEKRKRLEDLLADLARLRLVEPNSRTLAVFKARVDALYKAETIDEQALRRVEAEVGSYEKRLSDEPPEQRSLERAVLQSVKPDRGLPGQELTLYLTGANFEPTTSVSFGPDSGVIVRGCKVIPSEMLCDVEISPEAEPGPRDLFLTYPDGKGDVFSNLFTVGDPPARK